MSKARPKSRAPEIGDVYAVPLEDGRYGAVRVLGRIERSTLLAITPFIGSAPPALDDPTLKQILVRRRFRFANEPAVIWFRGRVPANHVIIGSIPLAPEDPRTSNTHGGGWESAGVDVLLEWRWEHDRENLPRTG